ncbi:MAG TPA: hypothetical protein VHT73_13825 [Thermodesulfobacteriota bacterium]|nr:hypothetical protein [Thermodesulfobacteriota bacterium]
MKDTEETVFTRVSDRFEDQEKLSKVVREHPEVYKQLRKEVQAESALEEYGEEEAEEKT